MLGVRKKCRESCLAQCNARRFLATNAGGGDDGGDSKGGRKKDGSLDFSALFKSVSKPPEKKEGAQSIDFKKLFGDATAGKSQFKLDLTPPKKGTVDSEKLRVDLSKLFTDPPGPKTAPGEGGLKGFKLDLSGIKNKMNRPPGAPGGLPPKEDSTRRDQQTSLQKELLNKFAAGVMGPGMTSIIPPKDHLLEKYLSVENMSAPELQKVEIQRVRREFQLHDADCGSSGVQIAALTKKISFLSKHLTANKKDVPSRRGMNTMIQRRRKLLIYLRRKDWEMYCHVLTRLSLKDRLDVSNKARQAGTKKKDKHKKTRKKKKQSNKYKKKANDL